MTKSKVSSTSPSSSTSSSPRFQIASRLGAFRDTVTLPDPLGTTAKLTIIRNGSNAHKDWFRKRLDQDPIALAQMSQMLAEDAPVLTEEEQGVVGATEDLLAENETLGENLNTIHSLLSIVERLSGETQEQSGRKAAIRKMLEAGQLKPSDISMKGADAALEEALFVLKSWETMPDENGDDIPFSQENARALLTNDTPLEDAGIDDLILAVDCWTIEIEQKAESSEEAADVDSADPADSGMGEAESAPAPVSKVKIIIPGLTLGRAYQLWLLSRSRDLSLFRDKVIEAAAKNSEPSSGLTN